MNSEHKNINLQMENEHWGGEGGAPLYCYTRMCRWIGYGFQASLSQTGYTIHVFVSWTGYLFPGLLAESSWVGLHEPMRVKTLKHVSEHGMFKALYWYLRSSLWTGSQIKMNILEQGIKFSWFLSQTGSGFHSVSGTPPLNNVVPPPSPPGLVAHSGINTGTIIWG